MGDPQIQVVLFDIDGTLIDSGGASDRAWHRAFEELYGVDFSVGQHTGKGVPDPQVGREALRLILGHEPTGRELAAAMRLRLRYLPEEVESSPGYVVQPGVEELLATLTERGTLLGLTTGNVEGAAHIKLARANLNHFFLFGGYGSDASERVELTRRAIERARRLIDEPLPVDEIVSVGDTPRDVDAGHGAGIRVVGVATGIYSTAELTEAGADWAVESLEGGLPPLDLS